MTKDELESKWSVAKRMVALTENELNGATADDHLRGAIKIKLRAAIGYLSQLDEHGSSYTMPFTGNQMKWALDEPVAHDKFEKASEWCHQCSLLRDKACTTWNYEEVKTA